MHRFTPWWAVWLLACGPKPAPTPAAAPEPATAEAAPPEAAPAPDPAPAPPPAPVAPTPNIDRAATIQFADGSEAEGHLIRVERSEDWFADKGWTDNAMKLTVPLASGDTEVEVPWDTITQIDIRYGGGMDVDCSFDSSFTPVMYICVLKTTTTVRTEDGASRQATGRHQWRFVFEDGTTEEFWIYKLGLRRQEASVPELGTTATTPSYRSPCGTICSPCAANGSRPGSPSGPHSDIPQPMDEVNEHTLLTPPRVRRAWYIAARSDELRSAPLQRTILGTPLVLFRDGKGTAGALLDRCPHRNVPLSEGRVVGRGSAVPLPRVAVRPRRGVHPPARPRRAARQVGPRRHLVSGRGAARLPVGLVRCDGGPRSTAVALRAGGRRRLPGGSPRGPGPRVDPCRGRERAGRPHTAFLHGGLFRTDRDRSPIQCVVQRFADRVECEYVGEARPEGIVGRLLSPSGGLVTHFDRFHLPSVVEVEYRIGDENHILVNAALTPVDDFDTILYAVVAVRTRIPSALIRPLVTPIALRIFAQDAHILERQTDTLQRFGEQKFVSTELDLLGPHILKLLQRAERGDLGDLDRAPSRREVTMLV